MSDNSARLTLPYIAPNQAQKHVTHNEAIQVLDAVTQLSVVALNVDTPPATPATGDVYALGAAPNGAWAGQAGQLAYRTETGWLFLAPQAGWRAWDQNTSGLYAYDGSAWTAIVGQSQNSDGLGIQTSWDATNRLAVSSDAALLSHAGAGHQLKINKANASETASVLFQSNWTGHAEFGLAGETAFTVKVSDDGASWQTAMRFDPSAGEIEVGLPLTGPAVQASATDTTPGRLMRADYGYGPGNLVGPVSESGGMPTGAVVETGTTPLGSFTRWADGTQICWTQGDAIFDQPSRLEFDWTFPVPFVGGSTPVALASLQTELNVAPSEDEIFPPIARKGPAPNNAQCRVRIYRIAGGTDFLPSDTMPINAMAIGRWF